MEEGGYVGCPYAEEDDDAINAMVARMARLVIRRRWKNKPQWKSDY